MALQNQCIKPPPQFSNKLLKPHISNVLEGSPTSGNLIILQENVHTINVVSDGEGVEMYEEISASPSQYPFMIGGV
jgi:hypothetical protein